jgi:tetratricopeptide (TPR) repeat protein
MIFYTLALLVTLGQTNFEDTQSSYREPLRGGRAEYAAGRFDSAEKLLAEALKLLPQGHEAERAQILADLGAVYSRLEQFSKAEKAYSESLSIVKRLGDRNNCALMLHNLGMLYSIQGRDDDALRHLQQAQELIKFSPTADRRVAAELLNGIGVIYYRRKNNGKAETYFNQALQMVSSSGIKFDTAGILNNLGAVYVGQHKYRQAEETLQRALAIREADVGPSHPDLIPTLNATAVVYAETGRFAEAEDLYHRALAILEPQSSSFAPAIAQMLHGLSATYRRANRTVESDAALEQAAQIAQHNLDKEPEMAAIVDEYSQMLRARGKTKEAEALHDQASRARTIGGLVIKAHSPPE